MKKQFNPFEEIGNLDNKLMSELRAITKSKLSENESYRFINPMPLSSRENIYMVGFEIDSEDVDGDIYVYCDRLNHRMEVIDGEDGLMSFDLNIYERANVFRAIQYDLYERTITYNN